jgi:hypothetical protein
MTNLSRDALFRRMVDGLEIKVGPGANVSILIQEARRVGANLNQPVALANSKGFVDGPQFQKLADEIRNMRYCSSGANAL